MGHKIYGISSQYMGEQDISQGFSPIPLGDHPAAFRPSWLRSVGSVDGYRGPNSIPVLTPE